MAKFFYFFEDLFNVKVLKRVPVYYFSAEKNVGDLLTPYLVAKLTGRITHNVKSRYFRHMIAVGSMMHRARRNSDIWGTGTLSPDIACKIPVAGLKIHALRGHLSKALLYPDQEGVDDLPLGDPAVLMKNYFNPNVQKKFRVGVIPHYVDADLPILKHLHEEGVRIIDVKSEPEEFVTAMLECEFVLSSSLHGLILADTYSVANKWVSFSNRLAGGQFKFNDYYSTTNNPDEQVVQISDKDELDKALAAVGKLATVKSFTENRAKLEAAFPGDAYR